MNTLRRMIRNEQDIAAVDYYELFSELTGNRQQKPALTAMLAALSAKPVNFNDVVNLVRFIEEKAPKRSLKHSEELINIVGTGGGIATFNISTTSAFVAAAAGAKVLKSGSYSYNSQCGSLDLLSRLGIRLDLNEDALNTMLEQFNIGFVSPAMYPPLLRRLAVSIAPLSLRDIGGIINTIGPLLCPFQVGGQICGVRSPELVPVFARALDALGIRNSIAVWAEVGMDEFSAVGDNQFAFSDENPQVQLLNPREFGMAHSDPEELAGGGPDDNIEILHAVLNNRASVAAIDTVVLNAAHILLLAGKQSTPADAVRKSREVIEQGTAARLLNDIVRWSENRQQLAEV